MIAPPGYPKTRSTPSARRHCRTMSAPLSIDHLFRGFFRSSLLLAFFRQPAHHAPQFCSNDLDLVLLLLLTQLVEIRTAGLVLSNPFLGELARLNVGQSLLHRLTRGVADDLLAAGQ